MKDERLEILQQKFAEPSAGYGPVRIKRIKITNYRFFRDEFELNFDGANLLVYGENGSGKSTIYHALGFLAKGRFDSIEGERNIFSEAGDPLIELGFTNGRDLLIDRD